MPPRSYHIELSCLKKGQIDIKLNDTDDDEPKPKWTNVKAVLLWLD